MTKWIIRLLVVAAALASIRYSGSFERVDVAVPGACVAGISTEVVNGTSECVYRKASVRGRVLHRDFEVRGDSGQSVFVADASVVSRADSTRLTWRSAALFLIAVAAIWAPALLRRFGGSTKEAPHAG
ncbi:hypothetical protein [Burkholderia lata]|uniref:hypothetical protein n=1 Tax=Burkholderia lata (strain ATCC 17760 / DSM 23089 / LMG 22485 / NCIMB 9086 / R18194 / 383) TaxID=482957 RepID=UPI0015842F6F|nr:hypothetical protein [Burkholderia lata]